MISRWWNEQRRNVPDSPKSKERNQVSSWKALKSRKAKEWYDW